jgi:hypothetical protein
MKSLVIVNIMGFSYRTELNTNGSNCKFIYYKDKVAIGEIIFNVDYNEINIGWLTIFSDCRKGYGSKMLTDFEKYVTQNVPIVKSIVLIPKDFDGTTKNYLCSFYEKLGFTQERIGHPAYSKNICKLV